MNVIFPSFDRGNKNVSLPNRLIAKVQVPDNLAEDAIPQYLKSIAGNEEGGIEYCVRKAWKEGGVSKSMVTHMNPKLI